MPHQRYQPAGMCESSAGRNFSALLPTSYVTPSFFCRLVEEVVYWNTRRLSG